MKLGELLILRGDVQTRIQQVRERLVANAIVQEGDKPAEDPGKLLKEARGLHDQLQDLIVRINEANTRIRLADGRTLTQALAERDVLKLRFTMLRAVIDGTRRKPDRYGMAEIKWVPTLRIADLQKENDSVAVQLRELNTALQAANWDQDIEG